MPNEAVKDSPELAAELRASELDEAVQFENRIIMLASGINTARSALAGRSEFSQRSGKSFGGRRNINVALGYDEDDTLTYEKFRARYERGGVAERVVEAFPKATWSRDTQVLENREVDNETDFEKQVKVFFKKFNVWDILEDADILAGIGRYAVIMIGAPGKLEEPLPETMKLEDVKFLRTMSEGRAKIDEANLEDDANSERFGLPKYYTVNMHRANQTQRVHHTRMIHVVDRALDNLVFGKPVMFSIWNYLDDLTKVVGGGSEASWRKADPGIHIDVDPTLPIGNTQIEALKEQVDEYEHKQRKIFRTKGTKIHMLDGSPTGFGPNVDSILKLISATKGYPMRILTGSEMGELASTQDTSAWNGRVNERRNGFAEPLVMILIDRMCDHGVLPKYGDTTEVVWPKVDELGEGEKAGVVEQLTKANKQNIDAGAGIIMTGDELREKFYQMPSAIQPEPVEPKENPLTSSAFWTASLGELWTRIRNS